MSVGGDPEVYWDSTPREVFAYLEGARIRLKREQEERAWLAWHIAALPLSKKFPKLEDMLGRKRRRKSPEQMEAELRGWLAASTSVKG